ncbi:hypothetical protein F3Y22_tig00111540pilonHSYRG00107 [Hibiscus syriacus]|uniref:FRIGIDA-like protein n=1 Tax=Hibiscus syriacus TaxID=106335 RepID=A0A6A2YK60_HIBSY|nr:hypothetical protein F3Y22_tig00111540pilonHSYRG00107 [Hibiscus syriacus]
MLSENVSVTPSLRAIESAIKLVDVKKDELKKAFDDLHANSMHLSSFSISWSDLDAHFTKIQNSVTQRFRILESRESLRKPIDGSPVSKSTRAQLNRPLNRETHRLPTRMLRTIVVKFRGRALMETGTSINEEVRDRAKKLALEWNGKVKLLKDNSLEILGFLHLVATYSLGPLIDKGSLLITSLPLLNSSKLLASRKIPTRTSFGCVSGGDKEQAMQNIAADGEIGALKSVIKIIEECNLENEYSQEPLQKRIEQLRSSRQTEKPLQLLLLSSLSINRLLRRPFRWQLGGKEEEAGTVKAAAGGNKHPKTSASVVRTVPSLSAAGSTSAIPPFQQAHLRPVGLLPDHSAAYLRSPAPPFGMPGSTPVANPYAGPSAPMYGMAGAHMGFPLNPNPAASHLYNYDRQPIYGAYGIPPQYHPSYPHNSSWYASGCQGIDLALI